MRHRTGPRLATALAAVVLLAVAAPAGSAAASPVTDCTAHLQLTRHYTVAELRTALATMPADVKEYTSCSDVIQRALDGELSGLHTGASGGSGGGSFLPVPLIALLVVLLLGGTAYGALTLRRRTEAQDEPPTDREAPPTRVPDPPA